jgi:hypothetical protein
VYYRRLAICNVLPKMDSWTNSIRRVFLLVLSLVVGVVFFHISLEIFLFALPKSKQENELKRNGRRVLFIVTDGPATFFFHRLNGDHHRAIFLTREFISHFYRFSFSNYKQTISSLKTAIANDPDGKMDQTVFFSMLNFSHRFRIIQICDAIR